MVPTLSLRIGDFTLAGTGDLAAPRSPIALSPGGSQDAMVMVLHPAPFPRNCSKHQFKQQSHMGAASPRAQRPGVRRGDWQ
jgi:hypothetical protein